jgi:SAM-dependent methyltransferase
MGEASKHDVWGTGAAYEPYVGRWSRQVAREFLAWLAVPPDGRWLDVGCGTGALSRVVLDVSAPSEVVGIDPSDGFLGYAASHTDDPRVRFEIGDARQLPFEAATFDAVVSGLALNFVPDPVLAAAEMARVTRAGGVLGAYVWDYAGGMEMMQRFWDVAMEIDPAVAELDEARRFADLCSPAGLRELFETAGVRQVEVRAIEIPTVFRDFDDYWSPFLGGQGAAPGYLMTLPEDQREAVRERLRVTLPVADDGTIPLMARAWAVRGFK